MEVLPISNYKAVDMVTLLVTDNKKVKAVTTTQQQAMNLKSLYTQMGLTAVIIGEAGFGKVIVK